MMGLPTETDEDLAGIASLALRIKDLYHEIRGKYDCRVTVSVSSLYQSPLHLFNGCHNAAWRKLRENSNI